MGKIVQARCPYCKQVLRIPDNWLSKPMRCKSCKKVFQARSKEASGNKIPSAVPSAIPNLEVPYAARNAQKRKSRRGRWIGVAAGIVAVMVVAVGLVIAGQQIDWSKINPPVKKDNGKDQKVAKVNPKDKGKFKPVVKTKDKKSLPKFIASKDKKKEPKDKSNNRKDKNTKPVNPGVPKKIKPQKGVYPRRALVIGVNDYLLANPLDPGRDYEANPRRPFPGSNTYAVSHWFTHFRMKFPKTQVTELSDYSLAGDAPLKSVIEDTMSQFLNSSRGQDRVVVLFSGHAVAFDEEAYLVPIEGDITDKATLIPISWVYTQLQACKARQKVFIVDVCRFDPGRGNERPGGDPMGEILHKQLKNPPAGVQVWSSCSMEQQSLEFENGSLFLEALCAAMWQRLQGIQTQQDSLPLNQLEKRVNEYVAGRLKGSELTQVSFVSGTEMAGGDPYDPSEPLPPKMEIPKASLKGGSAGRAVVRGILEEINSAPPPRTNRNKKGFGRLRFGALPPFPADVLNDYVSDGYASEDDFMKMEMKKEYPLRYAIMQAKKQLQENANAFPMKEYLAKGEVANFKRTVAQDLQRPGKCLYFLESALEELDAAGKKHLKNEKSKRWKAHYDYVVARLKSRLLFVLEYSTVLAKIRSDELPELEMGDEGFRLGSRKRFSSREDKSRAWRGEVRDLWNKIIADYDKTPWAIMARRERGTNLGLIWRATRQ